MAIKFRETQNNLKCSKDTVGLQPKKAYYGPPVPFIDQFEDMKILQWEIGDIGGGNDSIATKVSRKMPQGEQIVARQAPALLQVCLDELLRRDNNDVQVERLWEYLSTCYDLPRLFSNMILEEVICRGPASGEYYGIAAVYSEDKGHYIDPESNQTIFGFNQSDYPVKPGIVLGQKREEEKEREAVNSGGAPLPVAIMEGGQ